MVYAGVDIAKVDHVIGAVDERGSELSRPMGFKNSAAGFERCEAWLEGVAGEPSDVLVGMEATGHYWMALYAFLVSREHSPSSASTSPKRRWASSRQMRGERPR